MALIDNALKKITLKELCIVIISSFFLFRILDSINILSFNSAYVYLLIIFYFIFRLRNSFFDIKNDVLDVFSRDLFKYIVLVVILNIFFSYGMLYLSNFILKLVPSLSFLVNFPVSSLCLGRSAVIGSFIATVLVSPLSEELMFRGVALNRLRIFLPTVFAILVTSLLFAALHPYGSIISAFVFSLCMAVLYLKTDNIIVPIFAHFLNNLLAELIVVVDSQKMLFNNSLLISVVSFLAVISAILIVSSLINELNNIK